MPGLAVRSAPGVWLLDLDLGRVVRVASERVSVADAAGTTYLYDEGLAPVEAGLVRTLGSRRQAVSLTSADNWAELHAQGVRLDGRRATLRYWRTGDVLERAHVVASGLTEDVVIGYGGDGLALTIVDDPTARALQLPPPLAMVDATTWPASGRSLYALPEGSSGKVYPVLIGYPGDHPGAVSIAEPAFPVTLVEEHTVTDTAEWWLLAHGRINAAQATLWLDSSGDLESTDQAVAHTADLLGQTVAYLEVGSLAPEDAEMWGGLRNASGWGGGVVSPYTGAVLRGAGEVARFVLDYFAPGLTLDRGRMAGAQAFLDRFKVDGYLLGENAVSWLQDRVLAHLPVLGVDGPRGFYLAPLRWDATVADAVAHLDADTGRVDLDGEIATWDEPVENFHRIEYRPRFGGRLYASRRTLTSIEGDLQAAITTGANLPPFATTLPWIATTENDYRTWGSVLCRSSQARYGVREAPTIQHLACWDDYTAALILQYRALRNAWPKRQARYIGGGELDALLPGDVVTITDTANHLASVVALVADRTVDGVVVALDLVLLDSPLTATREV